MPVNQGPWKTPQLALPRPPQVPPFLERPATLGGRAAAVIGTFLFRRGGSPSPPRDADPAALRCASASSDSTVARMASGRLYRS